MMSGKDMTENVNYIKTWTGHLQAIYDEIDEKDLAIILISSLSNE